MLADSPRVDNNILDTIERAEGVAACQHYFTATQQTDSGWGEGQPLRYTSSTYWNLLNYVEKDVPAQKYKSWTTFKKCKSLTKKDKILLLL